MRQLGSLLPWIATASVILSMSLATRAHAVWPAAGLPVAEGAGAQTAISVEPDGAGGAFVIWIETAGAPLRMQRITANGEVASGWPAGGVALSPLTFLRATADGAGGMILFFRTDPQTAPNGTISREFRAWRYAASGALSSGWPAAGVVIFSESYHPDFDPLGFATQVGFQASADGTGGAHLVCSFFRSPSLFGNHLARVLGTGVAGPYVMVEAGPFGPYTIATLPDGAGGLVELHALDGLFGLRASRINSAGVQTHARNVWSEGELNYQFRLLPLLPGTDVLATWTHRTQPMPRALRMTSTLTDAAGWSGPSPGEGLRPICPDGQGGMFARVLTGGGNTIQRVSYDTSTPLPLWSIPQLPMFKDGPIVNDGAGGFFLAWAGPGLPGQTALGALHHLSNGDPGLGWLPSGRELSPNISGAPALATTEAGVAFALWTDKRSGNADVYLQRLADDAVVPVAASLARAEAHADRVELEWSVVDAISDLSVERRHENGPWAPLGAATRAAYERWTFEDRDVRAGDALSYRLATAAGAVPGSEAHVRVPVPTALALRGFVTNPSPVDATVEFSLPDAAPATLELVDVAGRTIERLEVGMMGPGSHRVRLAEGRSLSPGLYFVRLQRGGESMVARASAIR